jgi:ketosteroid isomerase-like protein
MVVDRLRSAPMSTTDPTVEATISRFLGALATRDLAALVACYSPDVDWHIAGNADVAPWVGRRRGLAEVRAFYELLWAATEPLAFELGHILYDGAHCVITGELSTRMLATGKVFDSMFSGHVTVTDGLITRYRVQEDSWGLVVALTP